MNLIRNKRGIIRCHPRPTPIPHFSHPRAVRTIKCLTNSPAITIGLNGYMPPSQPRTLAGAIHNRKWLNIALIGALPLPCSVIYHELTVLPNTVVLGSALPVIELTFLQSNPSYSFVAGMAIRLNLFITSYTCSVALLTFKSPIPNSLVLANTLLHSSPLFSPQVSHPTH